MCKGSGSVAFLVKAIHRMRRRLQHVSNELKLLDGPLPALKRLIQWPILADHQKYDRARFRG